jgi:protoporphyrinogen oxidase
MYPRGGFGRIVARLEQELLAAGVRLRVDAPVSRLAVDDKYRELEAGGETFAFDQCLFTGPSSSLAELLPADRALVAYRQQLQSVPYLDAVCVVFVADQSLAEQYWINIHEASAPFLVFIEHTRLVGTDLYGGRHVYYLGCYRPPGHPLFAQDDATLSAAWFAFVKRMFPHFDRSRVLEHHVFRFRAAQHVVDCNYERRIPGFRTPLPGLYLANFSQIFPEDRGTNFAVRDGQRVATLMLEDWRRNSGTRLAS